MTAPQACGPGIPYLGSRISLISKAQIRYDGILYTIDPNESTVALAKVRSYGTEDRPTERPVPPRDEVYEYIIFRGSDIKDIHVCEPPKQQSPFPPSTLAHDPAIVKSSQPTQFGGNNQGSTTTPPRPSSESAPTPPNQSRSTNSPAVKFFKSTSERAVQVSLRTKPLSVQNSNIPNQRNERSRNEGNFRQNRGRGNYNSIKPQVFRPASSHSRQQRGRGTSATTRGSTTKYDSEFDFDEANSKFQKDDLEEEFKKKLNVDCDGDNNTTIEENPAQDNPVYYDKKSSFFDNFNITGLNENDKTSWKEERKLNSETFGVSSIRRARGGYRVNNYRGRSNNNSGYKGGGRNNKSRGERGNRNAGQRGVRENHGFVNYEYNNYPEKPK